MAADFLASTQEHCRSAQLGESSEQVQNQWVHVGQVQGLESEIKIKINSHLNITTTTTVCENCLQDLRYCKCANKIDSCTICHYSGFLCSCNKICNNCHKIPLEHVNLKLQFSKYCTCQVDNIQSLKTELTSEHNLELSLDEQTSVSEILENKLDKNSIGPPNPGKLWT